MGKGKVKCNVTHVCVCERERPMTQGVCLWLALSVSHKRVCVLIIQQPLTRGSARQSCNTHTPDQCVKCEVCVSVARNWTAAQKQRARFD